MTVPLLFPRYREALAWAIELHGGVLRKAWPRPLVVHLIAVSSLVWEDDGDEDQAVGALLHDALVYGGCSLEAIEERFGARVAEIARDATDTRQAFDPGLRPPWLERRQTHINSIAMLRDHVLPVMAADKAQECLEWTLLLAQDPAVANRLPGGEVAPLAWYYNSLHHTLNQQPQRQSLAADPGPQCAGPVLLCTRDEGRFCRPDPALASRLSQTSPARSFCLSVMQAFALLGALLLLLAYVGQQQQLLRSDGLAYQLLNAAGASLLLWRAWADRSYGFVLLEGFWLVVSLVGLLRLGQVRR